MTIIYVLQLNNDKYYVGKTNNLERRIEEHKDKINSAEWVLKHGFVSLKDNCTVSDEQGSAYETKVTCKLMLEYGINNVRGAEFCTTRLYTVDEVIATIGHHLDLDYELVRKMIELKTTEIINKQCEKIEFLLFMIDCIKISVGEGGNYMMENIKKNKIKYSTINFKNECVEKWDKCEEKNKYINLGNILEKSKCKCIMAYDNLPNNIYDCSIYYTCNSHHCNNCSCNLKLQKFKKVEILNNIINYRCSYYHLIPTI
jgi:predicted GIY-YIG superfamily endonuclease